MKLKLLFVATMALAGLLFFRNIGGYDLWPADEPRFAQVAREMVESGNYLSPHINGQPYKEKPPLLFWAIALASRPFGDVTEFPARMPSALAALGTVLLTYLLASRLYGREMGLWSALILSTSALFWWEARSVRTDMLLTFFMTLALYAFWRRHDRGGAGWLLLFYAAMGAGLLTKGPPALIFPLLLIAAFYWKQRDERRRLHWVAGTVVAMAVVLAWFIPARLALPAQPESAGVQGEFLRMTLGRLMGESKFQWPWYYLYNLPGGLLPWALFLPWALPYVWRRRYEDEGMRLLLSWIVPAFVFFSISFGKRGVYLLPLFPALAILLAYAIRELVADDGRALWRKRTAYAWGALLLLLGTAPLGVALAQYPEMITQGTVIFAFCAAGFGVAVLAAARNSADTRALPQAVALPAALLALLVATAVFPALNPLKGASGICRPLKELSESGIDYRLYTVGFSREEYIYYAKHFHTPVLNDLLEVKTAEEIPLMKMAKQQRALRKAVAKAAAAVPVAAPQAPTGDEVAALQKAVHEAVGSVEAEPETLRVLEQALTDAVTAFGRAFEAETPAFVFIQQEDWKWLVALFPNLARHKLVDSQSVGRRDMLLLGNDAGMAALGH